MAKFAEDATLNTSTYDSDGFKKALNGGGSLSTIIWDGTAYLQGRRIENNQRTRDVSRRSCFTG
jgi:hypothetical protein